MKNKFFCFILIYFLSILSLQSITSDNSAQERLLARRAAITDAQRILSEIIYGIHIDSETNVRDFITENDSIKGNLKGFIKAAEIRSESYQDEIYKVKMRIDVEKLYKLIGRKFDYETPFIEVIGKGAPRKDSSFNIPTKRDEWYKKKVSVKGFGAPPSDQNLSRSQKILMSERAAKMDAYRNLVEQIKGVHINSETTVQDYITLDDTILTNIHAFVRGAKIISTEHLEDGSCEIILEISLNPLKSIVK